MGIDINFRSSEVWILVSVVLWAALVKLGLLPNEPFQSVVTPALVYIVGRVVSKTAKAVGANSGGAKPAEGGGGS